jgi:predicted RNA methylase
MVGKKNISNYPFGKNIKKPDIVYTQDIFGDGPGITGRKKKNKKNFVSNKINDKENLTQLSVKK